MSPYRKTRYAGASAPSDGVADINAFPQDRAARSAVLDKLVQLEMITPEAAETLRGSE